MKKLLIAALSLTLLAGCTTLKKVTGSQNDTVLPGQRQEILPPDQQVASDPTVAGQSAVPPNAAVAKNGTIQTTPMNPPPGAATLAMPKTATADCDPKVDLCPEPVAPEPLPPPSPVKVDKAVKTAEAAKPGMATSTTKMAKKKIIKKKKKLVKTATPAVTAPVAPDVPPPVPAPPQPQGQ